MPGRVKKHIQESTISQVLNSKQTVASYRDNENLNFSFEDFCCNQKFSSSFKDWQAVGLLSKALETIDGYCRSPISYDTKFTFYGDFPKEEQTMFKRPAHVAEDAKWARIHVTGPAVIVGHVVKNTFYVVFLDKTHKFFLSGKAKQQMKGK